MRKTLKCKKRFNVEGKGEKQERPASIAVQRPDRF